MGAPSNSPGLPKSSRGNTPIGCGNAGPSKSVQFKAAVKATDDPCGGSKANHATSSQRGSINMGTGSHHSILRVGPRLRAEGLMVPPASDAATLRRQVGALQADLEAHIDGEQRLQNINQQLRERLELYMKQNHENVERAEKELNALHEDMEQTLELQRRLAQRATALEKEKKELEHALQKSVMEFEAERSALQLKIAHLTDDLNARADVEAQACSLQAELDRTLEAKFKLQEEIQAFCTEADFLKKKADEYTNELQCLMLKERQSQMIEKNCRKPLMRRMFYNLREAAEKQRTCKSHEQAAEALAIENCCRHGLHAMQLATMRSKWIRGAQERQNKACLREVWRAWLLSIIADKKFQDAQEHRKRTCLHRIFLRWKDSLGMGKLNPDEEQQLNLVARLYWRNAVCKRTLRSWLWWIDYLSKPRKSRFADIRHHMNQLSQKQSIAAWRTFIRLNHVKNLKSQKACVMGALVCQRRTVRKWKEGLLVLRYERLLIEKALQFREFFSRRIAVKSWLKYLDMRRQRKTLKALSFRHYIWSLQLKVMAVWRHNVKFQQAEMRAVQEVNQSLIKAAMILWREYHIICAIKKQKERVADSHRGTGLLRLEKAVFMAWWEDMVWKRRAAQLERLIVTRRQRTLLVISLHCWMRSTFENLIATKNRIQNDLQDAKALFEEQKHQTTAVDVENLQLIDRLHTMSSEISYLKMTIAEKEKQEEELHRALEDGAFIESSMRGELEQQHIRIEELELNIIGLQKKLQSKNAEDTAEEVHHTLEIQNMEQAVNDLQIQLADKTAQLKSYEKALKETAEKLEGASDESQEKLSSAFKIASSLRKLLEDREDQYATLEGSCKRKELELEELQRKLAVANNSFTETVDARDARIRELECMLKQKHNEVHDIQQDMQELRVSLDGKENLARKLEYEIKLKTDQELHKSKNFVTSLSAWPVAQCDTPSGLRSHVHSIQLKESMRHVYTQAKAALQNSVTAVDGNCLRMGNSMAGTDASVTEITGSGQEGDDVEEIGTGMNDESNLLTPYKGAASKAAFLRSVDVMEQAPCTAVTWQPSFSPFTAGPEEIAESYTLERQNDDNMVGASGAEEPIGVSGMTATTGAVNGLQLQIQRLQARIKSQLRESQQEDNARLRSRGAHDSR